MKFGLLILAVAPLCCSDLCAVVYNSCMAHAGVVKAVKGLSGIGRTTTRSSYATSGCCCTGASRGASRILRDDEEENSRYYYND